MSFWRASSFILVIIGDGCVGKTCLLQRITDDNFTEDHYPTILDNFHREIDNDGQNVRVRFVSIKDNKIQQ